jgi:hypothetical protein
MEGLISEGSEVAEADGNADARDAALVGAAPPLASIAGLARPALLALGQALAV